MKYSYSELAKMIDHSLLHPTMTDAELEAGCRLAAAYDVASVCIKPYAVAQARALLAGTDVKVGAVIGFPHGSSKTEVKVFETKTACEDGAQEIDMVINIGKALGGDHAYVEADIKAVCDEAHQHGAIVKVIFENDFIPTDELKITLCQLSERAGADFVKTSSGYGFVKTPDGTYTYQGATTLDIQLMRAHTSPHIQVKAAGGVRDLDGLMLVRDLGGTRCGATATAAMMDDYRRRLAAGDSGHAAIGEVTLGAPGAY
jgi:deoxyribose-phosphate aldolase